MMAKANKGYFFSSSNIPPTHASILLTQPSSTSHLPVRRGVGWGKRKHELNCTSNHRGRAAPQSARPDVIGRPNKPNSIYPTCRLASSRALAGGWASQCSSNGTRSGRWVAGMGKRRGGEGSSRSMVVYKRTPFHRIGLRVILTWGGGYRSPHAQGARRTSPN